MRIVQEGFTYHLYKERLCIGTAVLEGSHLASLEILPEWRRRGYGSYLVKELLRQNGGYDRQRESTFTAPLPAPDNAAGWGIAKKFQFLPRGAQLCRRRVPDLTAVQFCHDFLRAHLKPGGLYLDATCGNGHDTLFLCGLAGENGKVIGMDIQPAAVQATNAALAAHGFANGQAVLCDHRNLLEYAPAGTADCVLFNFGWLPGAAHDVHSTAENSLMALQAGLEALRPGGVLAAVLYSGKVIGDSEKQAALRFFRALPLANYTVLVCEFANWADTAPLPCFVIKREQG